MGAITLSGVTQCTSSSTCTPSKACAPGTTRWGLSEVVDANANQVNYSWSCDQQDCYPSAVDYDGAHVQLYRQSRPDVLTFAIGGAMAETLGRLKTVDVLVGGQRAHTYALNYGTSASTARSLLASVQEFGRDAVVDTSGNVTNGTALPATTFGWQDATGGWAGRHIPASCWTGQETISGPPGCYPVGFVGPLPTGGVRCTSGPVPVGQVLQGDFNGDGRTDVVSYNSQWSNLPACLSTGTGWVAPSSQGAPCTGGGCGNLGSGIFVGGTPLVGDFNGDGKSDVFQFNGAWASIPVWVATGSGFSCSDLGAPSQPQTGDFGGNANGSGIFGGTPLTGDFNGGRAHGHPAVLVCLGERPGVLFGRDGLELQEHPRDVQRTRGRVGVRVQRGIMPSGPAAPSRGRHRRRRQGRHHSIQFVVVEHPRLLLPEREWSCHNLPAFCDPQSQDVWGCNGNLGYGIFSGTTPLVGDFNGDGKADILQYNANASAIPVCLSTGNGWNCRNIPATCASDTGDAACGPTIGHGGYAVYAGGIPLVGDFNGDGRSDLLQYNSAWSSVPVCLSTEAGWTCRNIGAPGSVQSGDLACTGNGGGAVWPGAFPLVADFNGDGNTDLLEYNPVWVTIPVLRSTASTGNLLTSVSNGLGGTTSVTYAPSSSWASTNNPPLVQTVATTTTSDGRGWSETTNYAYQGGLWDPLGRRFLGFNYAKKTLPCLAWEAAAGWPSCSYQETWSDQTYGALGKPDQVHFSEGNGTLLTATNFAYQGGGSTLPYTSVEVGRTDAVYDGTGNSLSEPLQANVRRPPLRFVHSVWTRRRGD